MINQAAPDPIELHFPDLKLKGFKIHEIPHITGPSPTRARRDFYKMGLVSGSMTMHHGDRLVEMSGTSLFFVNPHVPHAVIRRSKRLSGYACLFTEAFIAGRERTELFKSSPLCVADSMPAIPLDEAQAAFMTGVFHKMMAVHSSDYEQRNDVLRSCIELILHEAQSIQPAAHDLPYRNAATRITQLFMDLLERQFPVESPGEPLALRTAQDFATSLSIHINYLNRSVKDVTGKPTSVHIAERMAAEAKALLLYTDWSVNDISTALGFQYPTYFNNWFKKSTGSTPQSLRKVKV